MGCCPTTYWCTPDGPVGVDADEDGVYTPPEGATGGPYATYEEVVDACPMTAVCDGQEFVIPAAVAVSLVNPTGCLTSHSWLLTLVEGYGAAPVYVDCLTDGCLWGGTGSSSLTVNDCHPDGYFFYVTYTVCLDKGGDEFLEGLAFNGKAPTRYLKFTGDNGFGTDSAPSAISNAGYRTRSGTDVRFAAPVKVGVLEVTDVTGVTVYGSAEVWLS